jgi:hypothetical protein
MQKNKLNPSSDYSTIKHPGNKKSKNYNNEMEFFLPKLHIYAKVHL